MYYLNSFYHSFSTHLYCSPGFQKFVNVLCSLNGDERKSLLQFTTGCSSLPPGGLANLHPRLTIVRKIDANDNTYPSVNTCVHYLKLPEYSTEEIMKQRLLGATREKGFHLNWISALSVLLLHDMNARPAEHQILQNSYFFCSVWEGVRKYLSIRQECMRSKTLCIGFTMLKLCYVPCDIELCDP